MADLGRAIGLSSVIVAILAPGICAMMTSFDEESFSPYIATALLPSSSLLAAVRQRVLDEAGRWFPELTKSRLRVRIGPGLVRPRCYVHRIELDDGHLRR